MVRKINALKARKTLSSLLEGAFYKGEQYVIERAGRPMAALVPMAQLQAWQERRARFFDTLDEIGKKTKDAKPAAIEGEIAAAVKAVRVRARRRKR